MNSPVDHPRLCFVGALLGQNPGWVQSQGEILARSFIAEGYHVRLTSSYPNRLLRLLDIVFTLICWRNQIDLVIIDVFSGLGFSVADIASMIAKTLNMPVVFVLRGGNFPGFLEKHEQRVKHVLNRGASIVAPSGFLASKLQNKTNVIVIPNLIRIDNYPYYRRECVQPKLLWMRTFHEIYNPSMALDVLCLLLPQYPQACLTMAGQDKEGLLALMQSEAAQRGISDHVQFPGFLDTSAKQREFACHDIFINTNHIDNMPVSVIEAAAFGLPVVATSVGGIPYLLQDGSTALLVEDGNANQMVAAIIRLLHEPALAASLSTNGRELALSCTWSNVKPKWEQVFSQVV